MLAYLRFAYWVGFSLERVGSFIYLAYRKQADSTPGDGVIVPAVKQVVVFHPCLSLPHCTTGESRTFLQCLLHLQMQKQIGRDTAGTLKGGGPWVEREVVFTHCIQPVYSLSTCVHE